MIVKRFGCTTIHNKALYKCLIHSFVYVKYGLKIYREVWKFESGKVWNFEMENV